MFDVQVAPICTGNSATPKTCEGTLNKDLVLKVGSTATKKVVWKKDNKPLTGVKYVKSGTDDIKLRITNLVANDAGTYTASYNAADEESFTVNIPGVSGTNAGGAKKESTENGKDNSGGGGSSNSGTDQVNLGEGKGTGKGAGDHGGGVGGLSYSPALLVTVTLVHLLLQLAA
ncbi:spore wall protein 1-like [Syngnathus acus]|uniref:spore wall protein 1-like n=1 Tax=Syngnathus acus TaxID=161584 RepID=UPI001885B2D2|nr:spore wall protein 1-like [Syngnathus acus]